MQSIVHLYAHTNLRFQVEVATQEKNIRTSATREGLRVYPDCCYPYHDAYPFNVIVDFAYAKASGRCVETKKYVLDF